MTPELSNLSALAGPGLSLPLSAAPKARDFAATLSRAATTDQDKDQARIAAQKLVSTALVMPLLEEVREQPLDANLFDGGVAEDAFRQRLDQQFADRIVRSARFPLVDRIYQNITQNITGAARGEIDTHG